MQTFYLDRRYLDAIQRTDFSGVSGRISFVNGDRSGIIELLQYNKSGVEDAYLVHVSFSTQLYGSLRTHIFIM